MRALREVIVRVLVRLHLSKPPSSSPAHLPRISGPADLSADDLAVDKWSEEAVQERLQRIRAVATAWGASVSAITALLGAGTVIDADDQVRALSSPWSILYGALTAVALCAAALSIYLASTAAQFRLQIMPIDLDARRRVRTRIYDLADRDLRRSRMCALVAVVGLILSIGVRWYAPTIPEEESTTAPAAALFVSGRAR
jgi:hypothetical protein